jgi:hypothetical protein
MPSRTLAALFDLEKSRLNPKTGAEQSLTNSTAKHCSGPTTTRTVQSSLEFGRFAAMMARAIVEIFIEKR